MENSSMFYRKVHSLILVSMALALSACQPEPSLYVRKYTDVEKLTIASELEGGMVQRYYQGSPEEQVTIKEALALDPSNAALHRERGIAYLKRGIFSEFGDGYRQAVELDPANWQGWRGYIHLYFHHDYKRAIADFDALDTVTPNFTDYPQATSDKYMRAVAYLMLEDYSRALTYFDDYLAEETATVEEKYLGPSVWLYKAAALDSLGRQDEAIAMLDHGLEVCGGESAELQFYRAGYLLRAEDTPGAVVRYREALRQRKIGYSLSRPYVKGFYEVEEREIEDALERLGKKS